VDRPTIRQLESLVAVSDLKSFRKAATSLGISQPALSASVQAAEKLLGVQVFERDRRAVLVTAAGEEVVARARIALDYVIPTIAPYWLPSLLPGVRKRYPRLELVLREDQTARLLAQLDAGQLDAVLLALPIPGDFTTATIGYENFLVAAPRGSAILAKHHGRLSEKDLEDQTVLLLEDGHCLRDQALAVCERSGAVEQVAWRATSLPTLVQMVAGGLGITLLPEAAAGALIQARGPVQVVKLDRPQPGRTVGLAWRTSSGRLREFRLLADVMREETDKMLTKLRR
jgi:LysR family hydrogen peroxide-inducible transcriptional activator